MNHAGFKDCAPDLSGAAAAAASGPGPEGLPWKRRVLVDWRFQLRKSLFSLCLALVLLAFLNLSLHVVNRMGTQALLHVHPEMQASLAAKDRNHTLLMILGSGLFLFGVLALGVLQSHKTAGAVLGLRRAFAAIETGRYETRARLRRDDDLQDLAAAFNRMAHALGGRTRADIEALEEVMSALDRNAGDPAGRADLKMKIHGLVESHRRRLL